MKFCLATLALATSLLSSHGQEVGWQNDTARAKELTTLNKKLTDAYEREDIPLLRDLLSDHHIHNNVFGFRMTKDEFLKDIESGILKFESYTTPSLEWHISGDTAVATGVIEAVAFRGGKKVPATRFRFTRIFAKENGAWKVLLFHNTMDKPKPKQ